MPDIFISGIFLYFREVKPLNRFLLMNRYNHSGLHIFRYLMFFIPLFWAGCVKNEIKVEYQLPIKCQ